MVEANDRDSGSSRRASGGEEADRGPDSPPGGLGRREPVAWRLFQGAVLALATGFFLLSIRDFLNPFLLYCALVALLMPFRSVRGHAHMLGVVTALTLLWLLKTAGSLLAPFFLAFVLAYMMDPLVDRLSDRRRIGRQTAIFLILAPALAVAVLAAVLGIPVVLDQAGEFMRAAPAALAAAQDWAVRLVTAALESNVPLVRETASVLLARIQGADANVANDFLETQASWIASGAWAAFLGLGRGFGLLATLLGYLVLTPVLTIYLLRDYDTIVARIGNLVPVRHQAAVRDGFREYDALLSRYLRGQIFVAAIVGALTWLGLLATGFPHAFFLGATVAVLGVVPYLGLALSLAPAVAIALASGEPGAMLLKVAVVYGIAQGLDSTVISPRIVGGSVGLHPVWIVLALSLGGLYFGFAGLLLGVPAAVGIKLLAIRTEKGYRASALYGAEHGPAKRS